MNFKKWIFQEMAHISTDFPIVGRRVVFLDLKFETYPEELKQKHLAEWLQGFSAKLPEGGYLVWEFGKKPIVSQEPIPDKPLLPDNWWQYAEAMFADGQIKKSGEK